jgi:hypothetical protein
MVWNEALYEPPMLVEVGDFAELTHGLGSESLDAFDFFSGSLFRSFFRLF